jgi:hypothetical protein
MPDVHVTVPVIKTQEGSSFDAIAYFRQAGTATAPTTAKYRVDCLTTGKELQDWTSLTPAVSNTIAMTATFNAIQRNSNRSERKQLIVASDPDAADQTRDQITWKVENLANVS